MSTSRELIEDIDQAIRDIEQTFLKIVGLVGLAVGLLVGFVTGWVVFS